MSSFLTEGGPAVKLQVGETFEGQVLSVTEMDDRDPKGIVKKWDDGTPRKVWVFNCQPADGGEVVSLWVRGNLVKVLRTAAREAKVAHLEGATIKVQRTEDGQAKPGLNAPKLYRAKVTPGTLPAASTFVAGGTDDVEDPF